MERRSPAPVGDAAGGAGPPDGARRRRWCGRARELHRAWSAIDAGRDVVVVAGDGLGGAAFAEDLGHVLARASCTVRAGAAPTPIGEPAEPGVVLVVAGERERIGLARRQARAAGRPLVVVTGTGPPIDGRDDPAAELRDDPDVEWIRLRPLAADQTDELVDEVLCARGEDPAPVGPVERTWIEAMSGGYPAVVESLVEDLLDTEPPGGRAFRNAARASLATVTRAAEALEGLPPDVLGTARQVAELDGFAADRVRRRLDTAHVDALVEHDVVRVERGCITVPPPVGRALRLRASRPEDDAAVATVLAEVVSAVGFGVAPLVAELLTTAERLVRDRAFRDGQPAAPVVEVLLRAAHLLRGRGDPLEGAALARAVYASRPERAPASLRPVARGEPDDFDLAAADAEADALAGTPVAWHRVLALRLPLTRAPRGAAEWADRVAVLLPARQAAWARGLAACLRGADALERGDPAAAAAAVDGLPPDARAHPVVRLRAAVLRAACAAERGDAAAVAAHVAEVVALSRDAHPELRDLTDDLRLQLTCDALLEGALALGTLGAPLPGDARGELDRHLRTLVVLRDDSAAAQLVAAVLVDAIIRADAAAADSARRLFERFTGVVAATRRLVDALSAERIAVRRGGDDAVAAAAGAARTSQAAPDDGLSRSAALAVDRLLDRAVAAAERADTPRARTAAAPGRAALTARELEVARLAAAGLGNREIGERLHLSVRTVESHVYRVLRKLDVPRRELRIALLLDAADDAGLAGR